jgi:signal transduction histidine kinase
MYKYRIHTNSLIKHSQRRSDDIIKNQLDNQIIKTGERIKVLLVNNNSLILKEVQSIMNASGFVDVTVETSIDGALDLIQSTQFDVIISDYEIHNMKGMDLLKNIKMLGIDTPFIFHSFSESHKPKLNNNSTLIFEHNSRIWKETDDLIQKIIQKSELHRAKNNPELYSTNLDEIIEERINQLREAQKFLVIGELATMIGHDLRNPLQVIINFLFLLTSSISDMSADEKAVVDKYRYSEIFSDIQNEILYMDKIVSNLHDYAKVVTENPDITNISALIEDVIEGLEVPSKIRIVIEAGPDLNILGDYTSLKHIFSNLIINAIDSMDNGGTLSLHAFRDQEDICIRINDTGTGIPLNIQHMVFNPLFTTKPKGTGLGLSVVKRLIDANHGSIALINSSPNGSIFEVKLAASEHFSEKFHNKEG